MRTTWIGYMPDERIVQAPEDGLDVEITLKAVLFPLDTFMVVARRTGIFGTTIAKEDFHQLGGVDVSVLGTRHRTRTPTSGLFSFGDLRAGSWIVLARRRGIQSSRPGAVARAGVL
jgi:hypothetical protein